MSSPGIQLEIRALSLPSILRFESSRTSSTISSMSIFRFSYSPNGVRVLAYIAFPSVLGVHLHDARRILRDSFPEGVVDIERVTQVTSDWSPNYSVTIESRDPSVGSRNGGSLRRTSKGDLYSEGSGLDFPSRHQRFPALMYCRGGTGRVGPVRVEWMEEFCLRNFVVVAPCYRQAEGGQGFDEFGGAENEDVVSLANAMVNMSVVRDDEIFILGFSRGSINAFQTAVALPNVRALVTWGGVSDLAITFEEREDLRRMLRRKVGGTPQERPHEYEKRSPAYLVSSIRCPVLIVHGTRDVQVSFSHATNLLQRMRMKNLPVSVHFYEGLGHHVQGVVHEAVIERICNFLLTHVD